MLCPFCREKDTSVVDSRPTEDGTAIAGVLWTPAVIKAYEDAQKANAPAAPE